MSITLANSVKLFTIKRLMHFLASAGTNVDKAREIINNSGLAITMATDFEDVAVQAVKRLP